MNTTFLEGICRAEVEAISKLAPHLVKKIIKQGAGGDYTKMIDLVAEEAAISYLESVGFGGRLLSEELGEKRFGSNDFPLVVLDPIDGTTNAARGINFFSISAALSSGGRLSDLIAGTVMELPSGRLFTAEKLKGAFMDSKRIAVRAESSLLDGLIGVDLNVLGNKQKMYEILPLCLGVKHMRNMGSAALELCYVASGGLDLYADNRGLLRVTDIAAAYVILLEAGGSMLDLRGNTLDCGLSLSERISLVAGSKANCREALSLIDGKR
jgi:myo-inositol-1(or 4)-monophosphatase